jgi:chemotaxis signal transduction protein
MNQGIERVSAPADLATANRFYYKVGLHNILLELELKTEVLMAQTIYPLPFAPDWCKGLANVRSELVPVIDMHKIILGRPASIQTNLLLIQHPKFPPAVITCDGYPKQVKLTKDDLNLVLENQLPAWLSQRLQYPTERILVADHGKLLRYIRRNSQ